MTGLHHPEHKRACPNLTFLSLWFEALQLGLSLRQTLLVQPVYPCLVYHIVQIFSASCDGLQVLRCSLGMGGWGSE